MTDKTPTIVTAQPGEIIDCSWLEERDGRYFKQAVTYRITNDNRRIELLATPFSMKDEIKAMQGYRWHGFIEGDNRKMWSIANTHRNRFQFQVLENGNPYEWFERPVIKHDFPQFGSPGFGYYDLMSQQKDLANNALTYHFQVWGAEMGVGKACPNDVRIATPSGWTTHGAIQPGDKVIDPVSGDSCNVTEIFPQGEIPVYKITFSDLSEVECSKEHLWEVYDKDGNQTVQSVRELLNNKILDDYGNPKYTIPITAPVNYESTTHRFDPYMIGYLITRCSFDWCYSVTINDSYIKEVFSDFTEQIVEEPSEYEIKDKTLLFFLNQMDFSSKKTEAKELPKEYLRGEWSDRLHCLQGLLDANGRVEKEGINFTTASPKLSYQVQQLVQSIGGTVRTKVKYPKRRSEIKKVLYRSIITLPEHCIPFRSEKKSIQYENMDYNLPERQIVSVEYVGDKECTCILVDSDRHLYLTENFIVTHNTLAAIATMKLSGREGWWWIGPKNSLYAIRQEFENWGVDPNIVTRMMSYEKMQKTLREWRSGDPAPIGVIFDESQNVKTPNAQRTQSAQKLADAIRDEYGHDGYVILMTGTPAPKSPGDWWSQCEIAYPGFVREGSRQAFERRLGFFRLRDDLGGQAFNQKINWKNNPDYCAKCGQLLLQGHHELTEDYTYENLDGEEVTLYKGMVIAEDQGFDPHVWEPSVNEIEELYDRLQGLTQIVHKKDCMELPDKIYKKIVCEVKPSINRVARAVAKVAPNVITGMTHLRELSDGFQYREVEDGYTDCPSCLDGTEKVYYRRDDPDGTISDVSNLSPTFVEGLESKVVDCSQCNGTQQIVKYKRITREVDCPKIDVVKDLLEQNEEQRRIVFFAGFKGSIDRLVQVAQNEGWDTMRLDGRGWQISQLTGKPNADGTPEVEFVTLDNPLDYWTQYPDRKIAFISHPKSGGVSLTLCPRGNLPGAVMSVFYSNDFNPATRFQAEDRIHRKGLTKGVIIVDIIHLPTDERVLSVLRDNRKIELTTMGDMVEGLFDEED